MHHYVLLIACETNEFAYNKWQKYKRKYFQPRQVRCIYLMMNLESISFLMPARSAVDFIHGSNKEHVDCMKKHEPTLDIW